MGKNKHFQNTTETRKVNFHLYFPPSLKESYTRVFDVLLETHNRTYEAIYKVLKENPKTVYNSYLNEAKAVFNNNYSSEYDDGSEYYESIENYAVDRMQEQSLMHYQFELMSLSNLYQVFEQQLRKWLFEEMTHQENEYINQIKFTFNNEEKDYGKFISHFRTLKNVLQEMCLTFTMSSLSSSETPEWADFFASNKDVGTEVPIVETEIWQTIRECNLLSNTYKHGSGPAAMTLYKLHPEYFEKVSGSNTKLMNLYRTTNLKEVLSVDKISFERYVKAMINFWNKLKTHQNGSVMLEIDISSEQAT